MDPQQKRLVPDSILENLSCRICCKYLTVSPVRVHPEGGYICGRCIYVTKFSTNCLFECMDEFNFYSFENSIPLVLLGYATYPENVFPCVNRLEGCSKLLPFSSIRNHEKTCVYKHIQCPLCNFKGVGTQLVQHFRTDHEKFFLSDKTMFTLHLDSDFIEMYVYKSGNNLFLVKVKYFKDISQFVFDTLCLRSTVTKCGRLRVVFKVPLGGNSVYEEYVLLSNVLEISKNCSFDMTFKINNFHLNEAEKILCNFKISYVE